MEDEEEEEEEEEFMVGVCMFFGIASYGQFFDSREAIP